LSYQPHTSEDVDRMLAALGLDDVDQLFQPIPSDLRAPATLDLPRPHAEQEVAAELGRLAARNRHLDELTCFLGAGVYDHYVPASVWYLAGRGEFATSYTPYQPEMSQGVLQALFEYQTLISELTGLEISNASPRPRPWPWPPPAAASCW
jgi:glycine dehydrogenase subunit 1